MAEAKEKAHSELLERLESREEEKDHYRLARQREGAGQDVLHVKMIWTEMKMCWQVR